MAEILIENLVVRAQERVVLALPTLRLSAARIGVVGRNGSGKSTFARVLGGLQEPIEGRVLVGGVEVLRDRRGALGAVGILFQNPDHQIIFPTVAEELAFGLRQMGRSKAEARAGASAILARFGRDDWAARGTGTLSQGQKHLVCLMAVLAMGPQVIVLDEPFAGLDLATTRQLGRILAQVDAQIIHITHDLSALADYSQVLWIEAGELKADGGAEVLAQYRARMEADDALTDL